MLKYTVRAVCILNLKQLTPKLKGIQKKNFFKNFLEKVSYKHQVGIEMVKGY